MSRIASPSRLVPNTTALIARPGKITNQGAVPLGRGERARIAQIVAQERALGCPN